MLKNIALVAKGGLFVYHRFVDARYQSVKNTLTAFTKSMYAPKKSKKKIVLRSFLIRVDLFKKYTLFPCQQPLNLESSPNFVFNTKQLMQINELLFPLRYELTDSLKFP